MKGKLIILWLDVHILKIGNSEILPLGILSNLQNPSEAANYSYINTANGYVKIILTRNYLLVNTMFTQSSSISGLLKNILCSQVIKLACIYK